VDLCDGEVNPSKIDKLSDEQIKIIGTASSKVSYIRSITEAVLNGELNFGSLKRMSDTDVFNSLTSQMFFDCEVLHGRGR